MNMTEDDYLVECIHKVKSRPLTSHNCDECKRLSKKRNFPETTIWNGWYADKYELGVHRRRFKELRSINLSNIFELIDLVEDWYQEIDPDA